MRSKTILKNLITDVFPQLFIAIIGIFKSKILLDYLGQDIVGLYQLFGQIMGYLSLVEGGMGTAAIFRLYSPLSTKDYGKLTEIKNGIKKTFRYLALIILFLGCIVSFIIPFLIKDNTFSIWYILFNFMIYLVGELVLYFSVFERSIFLADEKNYKVNIIMKSIIILKSIVEIVILLLHGNLTAVLISFIVMNLIANVLIILLAKKQYKMFTDTKKADFTLVKDVKNLFVHKIAALVANNIDIVILSKVIGLASVVIYSTYAAIVNSVNALVNKLYLSTLGSIGNILVEDKEKGKRLFIEYNSLVFFIATVIAIPLYFSLDSFINIWYTSKVTTDITISLAFVLFFIYSTIRIPILTYVEAAGLFRETMICPILECIINLTLSLILVNIFGIFGVLISTVIALVFSEYIIKPRIIYKKIFNASSKEYYIKNIKFIILITILLAVTTVVKQYVIIDNLFYWVIISGVVFIINLLITTIYFAIFKELKFKNRILEMIKRK